jgi:plastocyanin
MGPSFRTVHPWRLALVGAVLFILTGESRPVLGEISAPTLTSVDQTQEEEIVVKIRLRQFDPPSVTLQRGRKIRLVFQNLDSELHAFVPTNLFVGVNLNVSGNGAPEFTDKGFTRVIIPPDGRAEIRFVPEQLGTFQYLCDMPGHDMKGAIVVQERADR